MGAGSSRGAAASFGAAGLALVLFGCAGGPSATLDARKASVPVATPARAVDAEASKALNAWFEKQFQAELARSPQRQTSLGLKTDNDKWDDPSDAFAVESHELRMKRLWEMRAAFNPATLDEASRLSYRLSEYSAERAAAGFAFRRYGFVFDQMRGAQSAIPAFLINQHTISTLGDAEAYVRRLEGVRLLMDGLIAESEARLAMGVAPPKWVYDHVLRDAANLIKGAPFDAGPPSALKEDFDAKVDRLAIDDAEKARLKSAASRALQKFVAPAYRKLIAAMTAQKEKAGADDGVWRLPNGAAFYAYRLEQSTTTTLSADEIHAIGLREMDRIHGEMTAIMAKVGFKGSLQDFFAFTRSDPQFYYPNTDEGRAAYIKDATAVIDNMAGRLDELFLRKPKAAMVVKRVEPFRERSAGKAFYQRPAPDGSRPGTYYANLYDMGSMPKYELEALAYHEGIPGHHMQIAIAQELEGVPSFRKFGGFTAYSEGWGLYTEEIPKEMGLYSDPYSDFGRLGMELWRAARLVVDTGLHHKRWSRQEAIDYLIKNTPNPAADCEKAVERYIIMPGQATAYMIGKLKIKELRARAEAALGKRFDVRAFHDVVLANGAVPLALLEELVEAWIAEQKAAV